MVKQYTTLNIKITMNAAMLSIVVIVLLFIYKVNSRLSRFRVTYKKKLLAISHTSHFTEISSCNLLCHKSSYCVGYNYIRRSNLCELFDYVAIKEGVLEDDPESLYAQGQQMNKWSIAFSVSKATLISVHPTWISGTGIYELSTDIDVLLGEALGTYLPSYVTTHWEAVQQVRVSMWTSGHEMMYATFNAEDSTRSNWMTSTRLLTSSYTDITLPEQAFEYFSVDGHLGIGRRFAAIHDYRGCANDELWFVVIDFELHCHELGRDQGQFPRFYYSRTQTYGRPNDWDQADVFMISVKMREE